MSSTDNSWSFGERFRGLTYLLKHTFTIVGRDRDILEPWVRMVVYTAAHLSALFLGIFLIGVDSVGLGILCILAWMALSIHRVFYFNYQETRQSWLVFETLAGRDRSFQEAVDKTSGLKGQIRILALIDIAMAILKSSRGGQQGSGILDFIFDLLITGLAEVWDLANHYLLPAVAVDEVEITEGVKSMKRLKDEVPESLVGVFGIDFIGGMVRTITIPIHLVMATTAFGLSFLLVDVMPASTVVNVAETFGSGFASNMPGERASWVPLLVLLYSSVLLGGVIKRAVTSVKVIYFTIFYTKITHEEEIIPGLREELTDYLKLEENAGTQDASE